MIILSEPCLRENLVSLGEYLCWCMQEYGSSTILEGETAFVGFNSVLDSKVNYWYCDGVADDVQINAALTYVNGLGGGDVFLEEGDYDITATLSVPVDVMLHGAGFNTVLLYDAGGNCITITGDNVKIRDLKIVIVAGAGGAGTRPNCIYAANRTNLEVMKVWLIGDETVVDDGNDVRQCGIVFDTVTFSRVALIRSNDHKRYGILLDSSDDNTVTGNTYQGNTLYGIFLVSSSDNTVTGNTCQGNNFYGISVTTASNNNTLTGNTCQGSGRVGIFLSSSDGCTLTGNTCQGNNYSGIDLHSSDDNTVTGNTCQGNTRYGIYLSGSDGCTVTGNTCYQNVRDGIYIDAGVDNTIVGNTCNENDVGNTNTYDGICIEDDSDYNIVHSNTCNDNDRWGISVGIAADDCVGNWVKNNHLRGNTSGAFSDNGTDTKLATREIQLIQGTTFISTAGEAWGWEVDDDGDFALGIGWLPLEVQQVVRIRVIGVALAAPGAGDYMRIQITGEGATFDEVFTTESIDVVDHNNEEVNVAIDDVVNWVFDATDDADIGDLLGGDRLQIKVLHEGAGNGDAETTAIVDTIQVEYV